MRFASRISSLASPGKSGWHIHHVAKKMIQRGEEVILLTVGDSDFASPAGAVAAAGESLARGRTHYTSSAGERSLRDRIARWHTGRSGQKVDADQVIVTIGAQNALLTAALCLLDPGDEVIVPEPMYSTYPGTIATAGGIAVGVPSPAENRFHPLVDRMAAAVTARTRAVFLATPNNPTGAVYTLDELNAVGSICRQHDLWLVSDEVYGSLVFEGTHVSAAALPGLADRTVTIGSLSKSHAMTGWRLGWMIAPPPLAAVAASLSGYNTYGIPTFIQDAAVVALETEPEGAAGLKAAYAKRRRRMCEALEGIPGIAPHWPEGGMFVMLDVRLTNLTSHDFAAELLREYGVATLPADDFGQSTVGYLRINLGAPDDLIEEAAKRIAAYARELAKRRNVAPSEYAALQ
jgi:arginine:pyruvate transaminase